jgi:cytochrome c peroxidase
MRIPLLLIFLVLSLSATRADEGLTRAQAYERAQKLEALGRKLFFDPALSASGKMASATCHDPAHGFAPANSAAVQLGCNDMRQAGLRNVPPLAYLQGRACFHRALLRGRRGRRLQLGQRPDRRSDLGWACRPRARAGTRAPTLAVRANESADTAVARAREAGYGGELQILAALEAFEQSWRNFYRRLSRRPRQAHRAGSARACCLQRSEERQLRALPQERARQ